VHAGHFASLEATCGRKPSVIAAALETAYREEAADSAAQLPVNAADATVLLNLTTTCTATLDQQQSHQLLNSQRGLYLTCLKTAATAGLGSGVPSAYILAAVALCAKELPDIEVAGMRVLLAAATVTAPAEDLAAALAEQFRSMPSEELGLNE
jgi:hypothetical protein